MPNIHENFIESYDTESIKLINTPSTQAKSTFFYIQEVGRLGVIIPHRSKREKLNSYLFVIVERGSGFLTYNGITQTIVAGQSFFIDCTKPYEQGSSKENPWTIRWIHFNGATSAEYYQLYCQKFPDILSLSSPHHYTEILQTITAKIQDKQATTELECSLLILQVLTQLLSTKKSSDITNSPVTIKCEQIKRYVDAHYTEYLSLDYISEKFFISKFYLTREFKRIYGYSIMDYVIAKRITLAKQLLRYTDDRIVEIAHKCGFHDQGYFTKQFKKIESITGKEYRKQWR